MCADWIKRSPVKVLKQISYVSKNMDEKCKKLIVSANGIKRSPVKIVEL